MIGWWLAQAAVAAACVAGPHAPPLPKSTLAVRDGNGWHQWWRSDAAPVRYDDRSPRALAARVHWRTATSGIDWGELSLRGAGEAWRTRLVVVRMDARRTEITLDTAFADGQAAWTIDHAPLNAAVAFNAGQFLSSLPWGWVVLDGHQFLAPSVAPLVSTITIDSEQRVRFVHAVIPSPAGVRWAFQSYPTLLAAGDVPPPLQRPGCGLDVGHRDARLALGMDTDGRLLLAMTRFDALGGTLDRLPFGLTTPEMAAVLGELGATDGVLLDGGISAQLIIRDKSGTVHRWRGVRPVPLALVVRSVPTAPPAAHRASGRN